MRPPDEPSEAAKRRGRVLFLTQYFPPETGAPQARLSEFARCLIDDGWEVDVLTAMPSYPKGRIFSGYRNKLVLTEFMQAIRVTRTAIYPTTSPAASRRLCNYFSFVLSSVLLGSWRVRKPDIIFCESPPLFLGLSAMVLMKLFRCQLVFNVSDLWPDSAVDMGLYSEGIAVKVARILESRCYSQSALVTGQSFEIVAQLIKRHPRGRGLLVPNGCDCDVFTPFAANEVAKTDEARDRDIVVGYAGLLGVAQGVGILVEVAALLRNDQRIKFVIVGDGPERTTILEGIRRADLSNIELAGHVEREKMPSLMRSFDVAFVPLRFVIKGALPSKIYEAMSCEVPVLLAAGGGAKVIVQRAAAGIVTEYDPHSIAEGIVKLVDDASLRRSLGANGREYVLKEHHRPLIARRLSSALAAVLDRNDAVLGEMIDRDNSEWK